MSAASARVCSSLRPLRTCEDTGGTTRSSFLRLDDAGCMHVLMNSGSAVSRGIMSRHYERRLYKRAITVGSEQVPVAAYQDGISMEKSREYAGADRGDSPVYGPRTCSWIFRPFPARCYLPSGSGTGIPRPASRRSRRGSGRSTPPGASSGGLAYIPCRIPGTGGGCCLRGSPYQETDPAGHPLLVHAHPVDSGWRRRCPPAGLAAPAGTGEKRAGCTGITNNHNILPFPNTPSYATQ